MFSNKDVTMALVDAILGIFIGNFEPMQLINSFLCPLETTENLTVF